MPLSRLSPFAVVWLCLSPASLTAAERPRLAVLTDIGGDPDDQQSMIRLMVYANEFDIELLARGITKKRPYSSTARRRIRSSTDWWWPNCMIPGSR
jgi:hypothetical protein